MLMDKAKFFGLLVLGATVLALAACEPSRSDVSRVVQPASLGDLVGAYAVYNDTLTNRSEHANSRFLVFRTGSGFGAGFLQPGGRNRGALLCFEATPIDSKSLYCERQFGRKKERFTIGLLDSVFCRDIGRGGDECKAQNKKCACYCIEHDRSDRKQCKKGGLAIQALWPPGNGAGSGGNH